MSSVAEVAPAERTKTIELLEQQVAAALADRIAK